MSCCWIVLIDSRTSVPQSSTRSLLRMFFDTPRLWVPDRVRCSQGPVRGGVQPLYSSFAVAVSPLDRFGKLQTRILIAVIQYTDPLNIAKGPAPTGWYRKLASKREKKRVGHPPQVVYVSVGTVKIVKELSIFSNSELDNRA